MNNTNLYKREYKQGINPHLVNLQKGAPLLNMLNTQNQIFHLNNLNNQYLNSNQALEIILEENYSKVNKVKNHHTDHQRLLNFSYNHLTRKQVNYQRLLLILNPYLYPFLNYFSLLRKSLNF